MKILFLGHYREGNTGWSRAAQELITAFDAVGADIVCRPVILQGGGTPNNTVLKCEAKSVKDCDIVIQCLLPHHLSYNGRFKKNIAIPFLETYLDRGNDWLTYLNNMDEVWVSSNHLLQDRVPNTKVRNINIPTDVELYNRTYFQNKIPHLYDNFVFYYIGDVIKRKNIGDIVRAFHLTFSKNEPVSLVLKVNKFGFNEYEVQNIVNNDIVQINESLRLYPKLEDYSNVTVISNHIPDEGIYSLHQMFDCYVSASHGEGWSFPLVDAYGFGNHIISSHLPSCIDGNANNIHHLESGLSEPVTHMNEMFPNQFTARESWDYIPVNILGMVMREVYKHGKVKTKTDTTKISYKWCGQQMMETLYEPN